MASDDDYFRDGIGLFQASSTGKGLAAFRTARPSFVNRYKTLATNVGTKLQQARAAGRIQFKEMNYWGESVPPNGPIRVMKAVRSPRQLPVVASILAHEASHCCRPPDIRNNYIPDELVCRTLEAMFYEDLVTTGVHINSLVYGKGTTLKLVDVDYIGELKDGHAFYMKDQLVDYVLVMDEYRSALDPAWVEENVDFWGGPRNRWSPTLGYFVRTLAKSPTNARNALVLRLMMTASLRGAGAWGKMIKAATGTPARVARIKTALSDPFVPHADVETMRRRVAAWGMTGQADNGLDCLP